MPAEQPGPQILQERLLFGGLTAFLAVLGLAIPPLLYAAPIPLGVLTYRQGMQIGTAAAVVSGVLVGLFLSGIGPLLGVLVLLFLALGLALGGGLREGMKPEQVLILGTIVTIIIFAALFVTSRSIFDVNIIDAIFEQWETMFGPELGAEVEIQAMLAAARPIFPAMMALSACLIAFLNLFGIHRILVRRGNEIPWLPPFSTWRFPRSMAITYVVIQVIQLFLPGTGLGVVLSNLQVVLMYLFIAHGLAVIVYFTRRWAMRRIMIVLTVLFALITPLGQLIVVLLGLVDAVANLRRLDPQGSDGGV